MNTKFTSQVFNIDRFLAAEESPHFPCTVTAGVWKIRQLPLWLSENPKDEKGRTIPTWTKARQVRLIDIPMIPYRTSDKDLLSVFLAAATIFQGLLVEAGSVSRTHVIVGRQIQELSQEDGGYRFWVGFAAKEE